MKITIVSPVYNEGSGIKIFYNAVHNIIKNYNYEIIFVDDGSMDATWSEVCLLGKNDVNVKCVRLSRNFGKEAALFAGISQASGDAVITIDSDLQHPPSLIPMMIDLWQKTGCNVVDAVKSVRQKETFLDSLYAGIYYRLFSSLSKFKLQGATDFKLMDRRFVDELNEVNEKQLFFRGISAWMGFRRESIFFAPEERACGTTKWSFSKKLGLAVSSLTSFTAKPLNLIWFLFVFFALFSFIVGGETLYSYVTGKAKSGFTTVIILVLLTGTAILFSLALLSVYIGQIFHEVKGRPQYVISEVTGGNESERSDV